MPTRIDSDRFLETLVQNAQKGEPYRLKKVDDPVVYEGIPLAKPGDASLDEDAFQMDVTSPEACRGLVYGRVSDIEWLERVR